MYFRKYTLQFRVSVKFTRIIVYPEGLPSRLKFECSENDPVSMCIWKPTRNE
jgi:hypothetical protein